METPGNPANLLEIFLGENQKPAKGLRDRRRRIRQLRRYEFQLEAHSSEHLSYSGVQLAAEPPAFTLDLDDGCPSASPSGALDSLKEVAFRLLEPGNLAQEFTLNPEQTSQFLTPGFLPRRGGAGQSPAGAFPRMIRLSHLVGPDRGT